MMKNSKLSKLLVAGVSVAVLASALAPMAFAEETSDSAGTHNATLAVKVALKIKGEPGHFADDSDDNGFIELNNPDLYKDGWVYNDYVDEMKRETPINITVNPTSSEILSAENGISTSDIVDFSELKESYVIKGWDFDKANFGEAEEDEYSTGNIDLTKLVFGTDYRYITDTYSTCLTLLVERKAPDYTVKSVTTDNMELTGYTITTPGSFKRAHGYELDFEDKSPVIPTALYATDTLKVPSYKVADGYVWKGVKVTVTDSNGKYVNAETFDMGDTINFNSIGLSKTDTNQKVTIEVISKQKTAVQLTIDPSAYLLEKDSKGNDVRNDAKKTVTGVDDADDKVLAKYADSSSDANKAVYSDADVVLPDVQILKADGKTVDDAYTFVAWEVRKDNGNKLLNSGKTAATYRFEDGVFDASIFEADGTATNTKVVVVPVFTKKAAEVTYGDATTPYDYVVKYVDGVAQDVKVQWIDAYKAQTGKDWKGGLFVGSESTTAKYYTTAKIGGKYVLDTSVNGAKEGYVFKDGVQDTTVTGILDGAYYTKGAIDVEAYGLKKIAGAEDDPFFYLVSDGVYQSDYNGMWEDEDGSVYKLEKGCTNTTFTGVYDRGDWALSVKDSKVQKDETGFVLYGETQYWFINGICNMKETEAVREHTDGNFYYTVGAKIDFTFNGECNGHTFVNGVASK